MDPFSLVIALQQQFIVPGFPCYLQLTRAKDVSEGTAG